MGIDGAYRHNLRTVEERVLWRHEHVGQQVLLTTREDDMHVGNKLYD